jgi:tRNA (guanine37-N1)-methyltransferase
MKFCILTLYPEMFKSPFSESIISRAQKKELIEISIKNIRDFAEGQRKNVDDTPFGGGSGMLMSAPPLARAISWAKKKMGSKSRVIFLSPQGKTFNQQKAEKLARSKEPLILLSGHFEGIDERIREKYVDEEISIGDFVLTGGEIPAMAIVDSVSRLIPGVLGNLESATVESFSEKLFYQKEFPQYTRPQEFEGIKVPEVLLSGNHKEIKDWQMSHIKGLSTIERKILDLRLKKLPIKTKRTIIRLPKKSDINYWLKWVNDEEVSRYLTPINPPLTYEDEEEFYMSSMKNMRCLPLSIVDRTSGEPIGNAHLKVDMFNEKSLEFGLMIGNKDFWGKGIATEILHTLVNFAFKNGFELIHLRVEAKNAPAKRVYEKCGFKEIGLFRKEGFKNKKFSDAYLMQILAS